jgi:hypothetical protein
MTRDNYRTDGLKPVTLGPKYALRLSHLREWHRLEAKCFSNACGNVALLDTAKLIRRWGIEMDPTRIEDKLRCSRCGNGLYNSLRIMRLRRNT